MNSLQHYSPPLIVLGIALYLGWPPAAPMDLGETIVKARAVNWKASELAATHAPKDVVNPFRDVLVVGEDVIVEPETGHLVVAESKPQGPDPVVLTAGLQLTGIATMGSQKWAIINGRPRRVGDELKTNDENRYQCEVVSVKSGTAVIRCEETIVTIRPPKRSAASVKPTRTTTTQNRDSVGASSAVSYRGSVSKADAGTGAKTGTTEASDDSQPARGKSIPNRTNAPPTI